MSLRPPYSFPDRRRRSCRLALILSTLGLCLALSGCGRGGEQAPKQQGKRSREFPVRTTTVTTQRVAYELEAVGSIVEENLYRIPAQVQGVAQGVSFSEGDAVTSGQELCRIDYDRYQLLVDKARNALVEQEATVAKYEAELADIEQKTSAVLETARLDLRLAESEYERRAGLTQGQVISAEDRAQYETKYARAKVLFDSAVRAAQTQKALALASLDEQKRALAADRVALALAETDLRNAVIRAPVAGVIQSREITNGQYMKAGDVAAVMVQTDPVRLRFTIPETQAAKLTPSMQVRFAVPAFQGREFAAVVYDVGSVADPDSREITCWARIGNKQRELRPGYFAKVRITIETRDFAIVAPLGAVLPTEYGLVCYIVNDGHAERRKVQTGLHVTGDSVEILSGLTAGEQLIVEGAQSLIDGVPVSIASGPSPAGSPKSGVSGATEPAARGVEIAADSDTVTTRGSGGQ